jgi:DnaJ like chaperone protein
MTNTEIMVSVVGALMGYWAISAVIGGKAGSTPLNRSDEARPDAPLNDDPSHGCEDPNNPRSQSSGNTDATGQTWYEVLSVSKSAGLDEVQTAYRSLIRQYHPDKVASLGDELKDLAERKTKAINQAYNDALKAVGSR